MSAVNLEIIRTRTGALQVIGYTTTSGGNYTPPTVHREPMNFGIEESVAEVGVKVFEWVAGKLEQA